MYRKERGKAWFFPFYHFSDLWFNALTTSEFFFSFFKYQQDLVDLNVFVSIHWRQYSFPCSVYIYLLHTSYKALVVCDTFLAFQHKLFQAYLILFPGPDSKSAIFPRSTDFSENESCPPTFASLSGWIFLTFFLSLSS